MIPPHDLAARLAEEAERGAPRSALDVDSLVRRSRARRRPALIGTGVLATVVIVGMGGLGISTLGGLVPNDLTAADSASTAEESGADALSAEDSGGGASADGESALAPDWRQNRCGSPPVLPSDVPDIGLRLDVDFPPRASVDAESVAGTVRVTNTGDEPVTGRVSARPAITLATDGITVWHTSGVGGLAPDALALDPGESREFTTVFRPLFCTIEDEARAGEGFDAELDALPPGEYTVSAVLDVTLDGAPAGRTPLVAAPEPVRLDGGEGSP